jgi:hypothetical protein
VQGKLSIAPTRASDALEQDSWEHSWPPDTCDSAQLTTRAEHKPDRSLDTSAYLARHPCSTSDASRAFAYCFDQHAETLADQPRYEQAPSR